MITKKQIHFPKEYKLIKKEILTDIHAVGYLLEHIKTKARISLIDIDDDNKVFAIGFRTTPTNDTGVPHIMEHSVLCGSKNFPVKDPFVELAKGSLNTFLNAITFPDKTLYPVASLNDKDFQNLMHVYLDAVFYPNIYKHEEIFKQEGWSYNLESKDEEITYNGVVYNEMKGAFSTPDGVLERSIFSELFPDNCYGFESGGDPGAIPNLSYAEFIDFHKKYYSPTNAYIYLYGDMDFEEKLNFINDNYLKDFEYIDVDSKVEFQKPFDKVRYVEKDYPVLDEKENATYYSYNKVTGTSLDTRTTKALSIICDTLVSTPGAPIEKALISSGLGDEIIGYIEEEVLQPYFSVVAKNAPAGKVSDFVKVIEDVLKDTVKNGIDKKALLGQITIREFAIKEENFGTMPKGLMLYRNNLCTWLYDDNAPFENSKYFEDFEFFRENLETGYFENLIEKYLLNNNHGVVLTLSPKTGMQEKITKNLKDKLESYKNSLSDEELEGLVRDTKALNEYKSVPSSKEDLAKIPVLERRDIKREIKENKFTLETGNKNYIIHNIETNGIDYVSMYFPINHLSSDKWISLGTLISLMCMIDTKNYTYNDLMKELMLKTGGLSFDIEDVLNCENKVDKYFVIKGKCLKGKLSDLFELIDEIIFNSQYDDYKRIDEILAQNASRLQDMIVSSGHVSAFTRALSHVSNVYAFKEMTCGIEYFRSIPGLRETLKDNPEKISSDIKDTLKEILNVENMYISLGMDKEELDEAKDLVEKFANDVYKFAGQTYAKCGLENKTIGKNKEAFMVPSKIQYVAKCGVFDTSKFVPTGAMDVLRTLMSYEYLWNKIRVLGGAYGCMSNMGWGGNTFFVTYRDPHLKQSLDTFDKIPEYLSGLDLDEKLLTKYVIGTMSNVDMPENPLKTINRQDKICIGNIDDKTRQRKRDQILDVDISDLRALSEYVSDVFKRESICVIGSKEKIEEYKELFDEIITLN